MRRGRECLDGSSYGHVCRRTDAALTCRHTAKGLAIAHLILCIVECMLEQTNDRRYLDGMKQAGCMCLIHTLRTIVAFQTTLKAVV